jgi:excisionase family DNA binding protein
MNQQYFRLQAVANSLSISTDSVEKLIRLKRLNSIKVGRCRLISSDDVETFLAQKRAETVVA